MNDQEQTTTIDKSDWSKRNYRDIDGTYEFPMESFRKNALRLVRATSERSQKLGTAMLVAANMLDGLHADVEELERQNRALRDQLHKIIVDDYVIRPKTTKRTA